MEGAGQGEELKRLTSVEEEEEEEEVAVEEEEEEAEEEGGVASDGGDFPDTAISLAHVGGDT